MNDNNRTKLFFCQACDYTTPYKKDYRKHLNTNKHRRNIGSINKKSQNLCCVCGKTYKHRSGLSRHKKICIEFRKNMLSLGEKITQNVTIKKVSNLSYFEKNEKKIEKIKEKNKKIEKIKEKEKYENEKIE